MFERCGYQAKWSYLRQAKKLKQMYDKVQSHGDAESIEMYSE